jgi:hypothetical protein
VKSTINAIQKKQETLTHKEKNHAIMQQIAHGFKGVSEHGKIQLDLQLEVGGKFVCPKAFQVAYNIGHTKFQYLCDVVKRSGGALSDSTDTLTARNARKIAIGKRSATKSFSAFPILQNFERLKSSPTPQWPYKHLFG